MKHLASLSLVLAWILGCISAPAAVPCSSTAACYCKGTPAKTPPPPACPALLLPLPAPSATALSPRFSGIVTELHARMPWHRFWIHTGLSPPRLA